MRSRGSRGCFDTARAITEQSPYSGPTKERPMASFTVNTGITDTVARTIGNNDIGTIQSGGTLSDTTDITWTGGSAGPGVTINNSGTITATTRGIDTSGSFSTGSLTLNNN